METLSSLMSLQAILALPWYVGELGLVLAFLGLWSAVWSMITLRFVAAILRLTFVFVLLIILTKNGTDIVLFLNRFGSLLFG